MARPHVERREVGPHHRAVWRPACLGRQPAHPRLLGAGHHPPSPRASRWLRCWMSARLRGRERLLAVAMGYGVIGSPTGSGPVSLGSSPGTPAEAGFPAHWPLANFAGGPQCFPGGRPPGPPAAHSRLVGWGSSARFVRPTGVGSSRAPGPRRFAAHWPLANFAGGPQCFPGGTTPRTPRGAGFAAHWPLANFAGGPQCFPGGTTPRTPRGAGSPAHWPLANFAGGPQCFPGGRPPGPPAWPTLSWWAGVRRPGFVPSEPAWAPPGGAPGPGGGFRCSLAAGQFRPGPAVLSRGDELSRGERAPALRTPGSRITRKRPPGTLGMGVPGDSGVGKVGRGLRGAGKTSPPSQGGLRGRGRVGGAGIGPVAGAAAVGPGWRPQNQCPPEVRGGQPAGLSGE